MTIVEAYGSFFKNALNFSGRARRKEYFTVTITVVILNILNRYICYKMGIEPIGSAVIPAMLSIMTLSLCFRRLQDIGIPGWISLLPILTMLVMPLGESGMGAAITALSHIIFYIFFAYCSLVDSDPKENKYGPSPKPEENEIVITDRKIANRKFINAFIAVGFILYEFFRIVIGMYYDAFNWYGLYDFNGNRNELFWNMYGTEVILVLITCLIFVDFTRKKILSIISLVGTTVYVSLGLIDLTKHLDVVDYIGILSIKTKFVQGVMVLISLLILIIVILYVARKSSVIAKKIVLGVPLFTIISSLYYFYLFIVYGGLLYNESALERYSWAVLMILNIGSISVPIIMILVAIVIKNRLEVNELIKNKEFSSKQVEEML